MIRFTRSLATRLRRAAFPAPRPQVAAAPTDAWGRFLAALVVAHAPAEVVRERELAEENLRLAVTLLGQHGRRALAHVLAACDGEVDTATLPVQIALEVAEVAGLAV
jgi:hypothetical protein